MGEKVNFWKTLKHILRVVVGDEPRNLEKCNDKRDSPKDSNFSLSTFGVTSLCKKWRGKSQSVSRRRRRTWLQFCLLQSAGRAERKSFSSSRRWSANKEMIGWDLMLDSHAIFPSWLLSLGTVAAAGSCVCVSFYPSARVISVHLGFGKWGEIVYKSKTFVRKSSTYTESDRGGVGNGNDWAKVNSSGKKV